MADTDECWSCGAPGPPPGAAGCEFCGAPASSDDVEPAPEAPEVGPPDLPAAREARRIRGWAVPGVAGLVVVGLGYPLTALAVTQIGQPPTPSGAAAVGSPGTVPAAPGPGVPTRAGPATGRARLGGAVVYDGPVTPLSCSASMRLATFQGAAGRFSILVSVPAGAEAGTYPLQAVSETFVVVTQLTTQSQTWTSLGQTASAGQVTVRADRSVIAEFRGLQASRGGAEGTIDGNAEVRCA